MAAAVFLAGCGGSKDSQLASGPDVESRSDQVAASETASLTEVARAVRDVLERDGKIAFASSVGAGAAGNAGVRVVLLPDGAARVDYLGTDPATSNGTYRLDPNDQLQLDFGADDPWLPMTVTATDDALLIQTPDKEQVVAAAVAAGIPREEITDADIEGAFVGWPLRYARGQATDD